MAGRDEESTSFGGTGMVDVDKTANSAEVVSVERTKISQVPSCKSSSDDLRDQWLSHGASAYLLEQDSVQLGSSWLELEAKHSKVMTTIMAEVT